MQNFFLAIRDIWPTRDTEEQQAGPPARGTETCCMEHFDSPGGPGRRDCAKLLWEIVKNW